MQKKLLGIDHPVVGVRSLEAARQVFSNLGFTLTPRGLHPEWGTSNACVVFERNYIELVGIDTPTPATERLARFLAAGEGIYRVAFGTDDADGIHPILTDAGFKPEAPEAVSRRLETASGAEELRFRLIKLPPETMPGVPSFLVQHLTPAAMRRPEWLVHPNGAIGVASLTAVVADPEGAMPTYERFFGAGSVTPTDNTVAVHTGNGLLFLTRPDELTQLHPEADLDPAPTPPCVAVMAVAVRDTDTTASYLSRRGIAFKRDAEGTIRLPRDAACGIVVEFKAAV